MKTQTLKSAGPEEEAAGLGAPVPPENDAVRRYFLVIAKQPYFEGLSIAQLKVLANSAVEDEVPAGQSIFEEGDLANRFYIILEGKVLLEAETKERGRIAIQTLGPSDDLGWSWMFPPYHTHFSARALTDTKMLLFYAPQLRQQCEADHDLGYELMSRVASVMLDRLQAVRRKLSEVTAAM
jgi:CRP/FNR family transcriptional regulator, cyclic AMP receptor protein